ncbi:TolC family protein [Pseudoduganella buxea]|uniref:Copper resistance-related lipoprotein n=1 Tax=Pseudoduganella buxea TaxID=1949069 RepID=A0A6I3SXK5_9BURK|nr:TolC family protein [Pseudoduganella buxea]MTV53988.1 RND transporter [Pseudoduganella buxea]GGC23316.1 copper resistance-related lipoprotein [Pseudoduganella buxea]
MNKPGTKPRLLAVAALAISLSGCATFSPDGGIQAVNDLAQAKAGAPVKLLRSDADRRALDELLAARMTQPLTADDAVQIALLNNRGLQASYWELGIAEADLVQAGRLSNPAFGYQHKTGGGTTSIERSLTFNLVSLITAPLATRIEGRQLEATRLQVANEAVTVASNTRRAWVEAVAATQSLAYARQVAAAADASADLGQRMRRAGNWSAFDQAREQAFYAEAMADVVRATSAATAAREALTRLMGLWGGQAAYRLPERLPDLPAAPREMTDVEQVAVRERLDIRAATLASQHTAASLGLSRATRFINVLELGGVHEREGAERQRGYEITLEIPLFDWGGARTVRAEAVYMQAVNRLAQTAADARSEARESYQAYRAGYDLARHYRDVVIPVRKQLSDETLLRYNGMLVSVFELLADAREQRSAVIAYIDAQKAFWLAEAGLEAALGGRLPATTTQDHSHHRAHGVTQ